jgi:class 3 adenylate cyclase
VSQLALSHTVVAVDIVNSSSGGRHRQKHLDRGLDWVLDQIFEAMAGSPYAAHTGFRRVDGDSATIALPAAVPRAWVAADLVLRELTIALDNVNRSVIEEDRLRLRVAIDHGEVVVGPPHVAGDPVRRAARLRDAPELRELQRSCPLANLGLIVSDRFFREVIDNRERGLNPEEFRKVTVAVKDFTEDAWVHLEPAVVPAQPVVAPAEPRHERIAEVVNTFTGQVDARHANFGVNGRNG